MSGETFRLVSPTLIELLRDDQVISTIEIVDNEVVLHAVTEPFELRGRPLQLQKMVFRRKRKP